MNRDEVLSAVSADELSRLAEVHRSTAVRWRNGTSRCPVAVLKLAALRVLGDLSSLLGSDWRGCTIGRDGLLYVEGCRRGFSAGEIRVMPYVYGELAAHRTAVKQLAAELDAYRSTAIERL